MKINFDRLKEVTKETIQRENTEDEKTQDILNIFKRFEPERDFIGDRLTKLKINKAVKPQFDENEGFVFKIVYLSDMNRRPELYKTLFQTDSFYLVKKELNNLLNLDTKNQFIKNYHKQTVEAIEQIDISETIENLLYQTMSKKGLLS